MTPCYQELTDRWAREEARWLDEKYEKEMLERYESRYENRNWLIRIINHYYSARLAESRDDYEKLKAFINELAMKKVDLDRHVREWQEKVYLAKKALREAEERLTVLEREQSVTDGWGILLTGRLEELEKAQKDALRNEEN